MNSIKQLIQSKNEDNQIQQNNSQKNNKQGDSELSPDALKKQWLGYLLISQLFDPEISIINSDLLNKNINILIN
jgi:hypothetical protein